MDNSTQGDERSGDGTLGTVTATDRAYMRKLAQASREATRHDHPAGTLEEVFRRMREIEVMLGVDPRADQDAWTDRESHLAYLRAVRRKASQQNKRD